MAKATWTNSQIASQLDSGYHWGGAQITFSYATNASWFPGAEKTGFSAFNASQKGAANNAIGLFDDVIAADFKLVANAATANLKFANTTTNIGYAHAYYPGSYAEAGSVWFNSAYNASTGTNDLVTPKAGQWGYQTYIHEIGHALGLDHPGDYNGGSPTYDNDAEYMQDSVQYTVMSYFDASETGADHVASDGKTYYAQTPMMHDILALQSIYGAETTTRTGNTVYGYNATADKAVFNFALNAHPIVCIYDAGGTDTLDLSGSNHATMLNLNPGTFSNSDMMTSNLSIAVGTWIENAVGGKAADVIHGNIKNNVLNGLTGNDTLNGGDGCDTLYGGAGNDTLRGDADADWLDGGAGNDRMAGGTGNDTFVVDSAADIVEELASAGIDLVRTSLSTYTLGANVENLTFTGVTGFKGVGNELDNTILGGKAADKLYGMAGNDRLLGGAGKDTLYGGQGADVFQFKAIGESTRTAFDVIADFVRGHGDRIDVSAIDASTKLAGNQAFSFIGAAAFKGVAGQLNFQGQHLRGDINGDRVADFDIHVVGVSSMIIADMFL